MAIEQDKKPADERKTEQEAEPTRKDEPVATKSEASTSDAQKSLAAAGSAATGAKASQSGSAPGWLAVAYFVGLALIYLGQRVVVEAEVLRDGLTALGAAACVIATALRFVPSLRGRGEHARVATLLSSLQLLGIVGLLLYFVAGNEAGLTRLGIEDPEQRERVGAVVSVLWVVCLAVACLPLLFAEIALNPMRRATFVESRRVQTAAASGAMLGLALSYGSLFVYSASQAEAQADFSYFKTSEPGEATVKLLQKMTDPAIQVTGFFPEVSEVRSEVKSYLTQLKRRAPTFEFQLVDRYLEPKLAKELKVVSDGSLVISQKGTTKILTLRIGTELDKARDKLKTLDKDFYGEVFKLLRAQRTAYATVGHRELNDHQRGAQREEGRSANLLKELVEHQNYRVKNLGLSEGLANDVPHDATIVFVLAPMDPFAPEELASLKRYLERGGKVFLALDTDGIATGDTLGSQALDELGQGPSESDQPADVRSAMAPKDEVAAAKKEPAQTEPAAKDETEGKQTTGANGSEFEWMRELAQAVGVEFNPVKVADPSRFVPRRNNPSDREILFTNQFSSHASVSTLSRNSSRAAVVLSGAGTLEPVPGSDAKADVAVRSYSSAFADEDGDFERDDSEPSRAFSLALALSKKTDVPVEKSQKAEGKTAHDEKADDKEAKEGDAKTEKPEEESNEFEEMRAFVLADADALSDLFLARFQANQLLALDAIRWLGGEESFAGELETEEDVRIEHTKQEDQAWFYSTIFGVPLSVLGLGLFFSRRARKAGHK